MNTRQIGARLMLGLAALSAVAADPASLSPSAAQPAAAEERAFELSFVEADVRRVVEAVLGQMLARDYVLDPQVQGNISLRTAAPVPEGALVGLLENAVSALGAIIVDDGDIIRVLPRSAAAGSIALSSGPSVAGFGTEPVILRYSEASEIAKVLERLLGAEVVAGVDAPSNTIFLRGSGADRSAAQSIINRFDVDQFREMQVTFIPVRNSEVRDLERDLRRVLTPLGLLGRRAQIIALPRTGSLLLLARDQTDISRIMNWAVQLDDGALGTAPRLYSYFVQNGRAVDLARTLQQIFVGGATTPDLVPIAGSPEPLPQAGAIAAPEVSFEASPLVEEADDFAVASSGAGPRIVPSRDNNALLIYASPKDYEFILEALGQIDKPVAQVLIEATLAEVTLTDDLSFGVDWSIITGRNNISLFNSESPNVTRLFPGYSQFIDGRDVDFVLNALESETDVEVLSSPRLMVRNNSTAILQVGDQVPIVTQQAQSTAAAGAPLVNTIELRDTGVILRVTPRVNDNGIVTLDIAQEVSDVVQTTTSGINSPTIQQRRLTSTVTTRSGEMIALGGLIRDRTSEIRSGIPFLSQIPIIGGLFGSQDQRRSRTELILLLTPTVMRSEEEARAVLEDLMDGLERSREMLQRLEKDAGDAPTG